MSFLSELKRRNVFKVAMAYLIVGWLIIQVVNAIALPLGFPTWTVAFFIVIVAAGLPIALLLSWAYEITPSGMQPSHTIDEPKSITIKTGRTIDRIIIVGLLLALTYFIMDKQGYFEADIIETPISHAGEHSIAVLPFVNMSDDESNEFFSDGISEEILNVLVRVDGLAVASRTSSFLTKGSDLNIVEIADKLGVAHVLEGSVRKHDNRVRITAQLIDARHDIHLWSETYDRELTDIFAIQDEIANAIVLALREALDDDELQPVSVGVATESMDAYEMYLEGRSLFLGRDPLGIRHSIELFTAATERDPNFAKAWAGLAGSYAVVSGYAVPDGYEAIESSHELAKEYALKAIELDPTLSLGYAALGLAYENMGEYEGANEAYEKALYYDTNNPTAHLWRGIFYYKLGYLEKAADEFKRAYHLAPEVGIFEGYYALSFYIKGDYDNAIKHATSALLKGRPTVLDHLYGIYYKAGRNDDAKLAAYSKFVAMYGMSYEDASNLTILLDEIYTDGANAAEAKEELYAKVLEHKLNDKLVYSAIDLTIESGEFEVARELFTENRGFIWLWLTTFAEFHESDSFKTLLEDSGIADFWRKHDFPDQCEPLDEDDIDGDFVCSAD